MLPLEHDACVTRCVLNRFSRSAWDSRIAWIAWITGIAGRARVVRSSELGDLKVVNFDEFWRADDAKRISSPLPFAGRNGKMTCAAYERCAMATFIMAMLNILVKPVCSVLVTISGTFLSPFVCLFILAWIELASAHWSHWLQFKAFWEKPKLLYAIPISFLKGIFTLAWLLGEILLSKFVTLIPHSEPNDRRDARRYQGELHGYFEAIASKMNRMKFCEAMLVGLEERMALLLETCDEIVNGGRERTFLVPFNVSSDNLDVKITHDVAYSGGRIVILKTETEARLS